MNGKEENSVVSYVVYLNVGGVTMRWEIRDVKYVKSHIRNCSRISQIPDDELTSIIVDIIETRLLTIDVIKQFYEQDDRCLVFLTKVAIYSSDFNESDRISFDDIKGSVNVNDNVEVVAEIVAMYVSSCIVKYVVNPKIGIDDVVKGIIDTVVWNADAYMTYVIMFPAGNMVVVKTGALVNNDKLDKEEANKFGEELFKSILNEVSKFSGLLSNEMLKSWKSVL